MWPESTEQPAPLRSGLTTGSCATACSVAAAIALLGGKQPSSVTIELPKAKRVELQIHNYKVCANGAQHCEAIKDAGDDPDVTHGATLFVKLQLRETTGVEFVAGTGVGTVTRAGLALAVGEPAINPVPRQMIRDNLAAVAEQYAYAGGFRVTVGVVDGETIAAKTMNPRLGIVGGLSILGTTGIVRPYSCAAWIASIHQGIDVANANTVNHIAATTGSSSEAAIKAVYGFDEMALIEMGDFAGAVLKHLRKLSAPQTVAQLTLCGGFGKITKLAAGHRDLNSRVSAIDFEHIAAMAQRAGANSALCQKVLAANTSIEALNLCAAQGVDLAAVVCEQALCQARKILPARMALEIRAIDRRGQFVGRAVDANWPL